MAGPAAAGSAEGRGAPPGAHLETSSPAQGLTSQPRLLSRRAPGLDWTQLFSAQGR